MTRRRTRHPAKVFTEWTHDHTAGAGGASVGR